MPNEWRPSWNRWVDERRMIIWILPVSNVVIIGATLIIGIAVYSIWVEDFGTNLSKKIALLGFGCPLFLGGIYMNIGFYQMFFIELRRKFITRQVVWDGSGYKLKGYYFKQDAFQPADIASVEEYRVGHRYLSGTILTLLNRTPKANYKVTLKDGRAYYLPGDIERVNELKALLETDIRTGFTP